MCHPNVNPSSYFIFFPFKFEVRFPQFCCLLTQDTECNEFSTSSRQCQFQATAKKSANPPTHFIAFAFSSSNRFYWDVYEDSLGVYSICLSVCRPWDKFPANEFRRKADTANTVLRTFFFGKLFNILLILTKGEPLFTFIFFSYFFPPWTL